MEGRCLCEAVAFELGGPATPIELCHCVRCRRAYGSAFAATFYVKAANFRWLRGQKMIAIFDAPLRDKAPPYRHSFCRVCGSPLPIEQPPLVEIPASLVDGDVGSRPAYHKWVRQKAPWWNVDPALPRYEEASPSEERMCMFEMLERD